LLERFLARSSRHDILAELGENEFENEQFIGKVIDD
jgi:hypothetical protein